LEDNDGMDIFFVSDVDNAYMFEIRDDSHAPRAWDKLGDLFGLAAIDVIKYILL
jgi:hypothetical protein